VESLESAVRLREINEEKVTAEVLQGNAVSSSSDPIGLISLYISASCSQCHI
jgi:hypothetical protein